MFSTAAALPVPRCYDPAIWLDAKDPAGTQVQPANASLLTTWYDKSGNNNTFTGSGANRPTFSTNTLNGLPTISFTPTNFMDMVGTVPFRNAANEYTVFVVGKTNTTGQQNFFGNGRVGVNGVAIQPRGNTAFFGCLYGGAAFIPTNVPTDSAYHVLNATLLGTTTSFYIGNVSQTITAGQGTTPVTPAGGNSRIGSDDAAGASLNGNIAEIIYFDYPLTAAQRTSVYQYLNAKWAV